MGQYAVEIVDKLPMQGSQQDHRISRIEDQRRRNELGEVARLGRIDRDSRKRDCGEHDATMRDDNFGRGVKQLTEELHQKICPWFPVRKNSINLQELE